jgi:hypothetical protein
MNSSANASPTKPPSLNPTAPSFKKEAESVAAESIHLAPPRHRPPQERVEDIAIATQQVTHDSLSEDAVTDTHVADSAAAPSDAEATAADDTKPSMIGEPNVNSGIDQISELRRSILDLKDRYETNKLETDRRIDHLFRFQEMKVSQAAGIPLLNVQIAHGETSAVEPAL